MGYDSTSAADRLSAVRSAMADCLIAQEYETRASRRKRMADWKDLRDTERELQQEVEAAANGGRMSTLGIRVPPT